MAYWAHSKLKFKVGLLRGTAIAMVVINFTHVTQTFISKKSVSVKPTSEVNTFVLSCNFVLAI